MLLDLIVKDFGLLAVEQEHVLDLVVLEMVEDLEVLMPVVVMEVLHQTLVTLMQYRTPEAVVVEVQTADLEQQLQVVAVLVLSSSHTQPDKYLKT